MGVIDRSGVYTARIARKDALAIDREAPVHAAYERSENTGSFRTACGRVMWLPLEYAAEARVSCRQCVTALEPHYEP